MSGDLIERLRAATLDDGVSEPIQPDEYTKLCTEAIAELERLSAEVAQLHQYRHGHLPTCDGMNEAEQRCACGYLQGEAYRELIERAGSAEATVERLSKDAQRDEVAWLIEYTVGWGHGNYWGNDFPQAGMGWVTVDSSVRFSRKEDAERVIAVLIAQDKHYERSPAKYVATEHMWPSAAIAEANKEGKV